MQCGNTSVPTPKLFTNLPEASNFRIGGKGESEQANGRPGFIIEGGANEPQRSATQTLTLSRSMSTAFVEPQVRPSGNLGQFSIARYGLGAELAIACANTALSASSTAATATMA
jgi:hypothetical protein